MTARRAPPIVLCGSLSTWAVTLGAAMHEAGYAACGLRWRYVPFEVGDLRGALSGMRALGIRGLGVSMPFKLDVMPLLDAIDPLAARVGAVNTIVNDDGVLTGFNTDGTGAARALKEQLRIDGARALVLGGGGAARAVAHGLSDGGAHVTCCNRTATKAAAIAAAVGGTQRDWSGRHRLDDIDVVVNATSLGMTDVDPTSPIDSAALTPAHVVMDIVYKPLATELLQGACARGAVTIDGGRMLLHQAARQFELYTGRDAPLDAMDAALRAEIG
jgi:shikimate dehydrogenase